MNISERIRELREEKGWSQKDLSVQTRLTQQGISLIEKGAREPGISTVLAIAKALSVSVDYLIGYDEAERHQNELILSSQEKELIVSFRELSSGMKRNVIEMVESLSGVALSNKKID